MQKLLDTWLGQFINPNDSLMNLRVVYVRVKRSGAILYTVLIKFDNGSVRPGPFILLHKT